VNTYIRLIFIHISFRKSVYIHYFLSLHFIDSPVILSPSAGPKTLHRITFQIKLAPICSFRIHDFVNCCGTCIAYVVSLDRAVWQWLAGSIEPVHMNCKQIHSHTSYVCKLATFCNIQLSKDRNQICFLCFVLLSLNQHSDTFSVV
jgi:hypothetical protein